MRGRLRVSGQAQAGQPGGAVPDSLLDRPGPPAQDLACCRVGDLGDRCSSPTKHGEGSPPQVSVAVRINVQPSQPDPGNEGLPDDAIDFVEHGRRGTLLADMVAVGTA